MRKLLLIGAALLTAISVFADQREFEAGYYAGWAAGYKHAHGEFAIPPIAPIPHIAPVGEDSFGEGFIYGMEAVQSYYN